MKPKVLIVEDRENILKKLKDKLEKASEKEKKQLEIVTCTAFQEASDLISKNRFEIVVLDMHLPNTKGGQSDEAEKTTFGEDLISEIKKKSSKTKIIIITGETRQKQQDRFLNEGFAKESNEYILKGEDNFFKILNEKILYFANLFILANNYDKQDTTNLLLTFAFDKSTKDYFLKHAKEYTLFHALKEDEIYDRCKSEPVCAVVVKVDKDRGMLFVSRFLAHRQDIPVVAISEVLDSEGLNRLKETIKRGAATAARLFDHDNYLMEALKKAKETTDKKLKSFSNFIGSHPAFVKAIGTADFSASNEASVLITGESGTGKEVMARCIHDQSERKGQFVPINCASIPETLLEAELFGYEKGAFTGAEEKKEGLFETAKGGTLFLDEIAEMTPNLQAKLLRVLQEKKVKRLGSKKEDPVNVKIIAATNRDISQQIKSGKFRNDLYHRLNVFSIHLPPLRERKSDIPKMVYHFINVFSETYNKGVIGIEKKAMDQLKSKDWYSGNVRELKNFIERIIARLPMCKELITIADIEDESMLNEEAPEEVFTIELPRKLIFNDSKPLSAIAYLSKSLLWIEAYIQSDYNVDSATKEMKSAHQTFYNDVDAGIKRALNHFKNNRQATLSLFSGDNNKIVETFINSRIKKIETEYKADS